jgi:FkbM family methyltransferase
MRLKLFWSPVLLCERLAMAAQRRRRLGKLRKSVAASLELGHVDSLELLEIARELGIKTIFDIGANVGSWTLLARAIIPEARIEAFEPLSEHCRAFERGLAALPLVTLHPVALGSVSGVGSLRRTSFSDASSLLQLTEIGVSEFGVVETAREEIAVEQLDEYVLAHSLPAPDLVKLDVQGYELEVLVGAGWCLRTAKAVITEVSFREYYEGQPLFSKVVAFFGERGFELFALSQTTQLGSPLGQTDALFVRRR